MEELNIHKLEELDMKVSLHDTNLRVAKEAIAVGNIKLQKTLPDKKTLQRKDSEDRSHDRHRNRAKECAN